MIYLLLGTNLGFKRVNLNRAVKLLEKALNTDFIKTPKVKTDAVGFEGPVFLNQIVAFEAKDGLKPLELLDICQQIEQKMGRKAHKAEYDAEGNRVYVSRIIDIDILFFNEMKIQSERLTLPHPQVETRPFVKEILKLL